MDSRAGERGFVHQAGEDDFGREAGESFAGCGQEEAGGAADASAEDDDVRMEGGGVLVEGQAEMPAKVLEGAAGTAVGQVRIFRRGGYRRQVFGAWRIALGGVGDDGDLGFHAGEGLVLGAQIAGGNEVLDRKSVV